LATLKSDFDKYKTKISPDVIRSTFTSVIRQTCEKFNFSDSHSNISHQQSKASTTLLERARIVHRITGTHGNGIPIGGDINPKQNKFLLLDIGLYLCEAKLDVSNWILDPGAKFVNRGKMAEMFVALEILKNASPYDDAKLFYWHKESKNSNAEVDYVVQYRNRILPIEVKSGKSGSMASLRMMMESKNLTLGVRTSEENFGTLEDQVRIIPLYLIGEYDRILRAAGDGGDGL
jgi:predicted AAA+ superfamily ATPase